MKYKEQSQEYMCTSAPHSKDCKVGTEIKRYLLQIEEKFEVNVTIGKITINLKDNRDGNVVESVEGGGECGLHGSGRPAECFRWH